MTTTRETLTAEQCMQLAVEAAAVGDVTMEHAARRAAWALVHDATGADALSCVSMTLGAIQSAEAMDD